PTSPCTTGGPPTPRSWATGTATDGTPWASAAEATGARKYSLHLSRNRHVRSPRSAVDRGGIVHPRNATQTPSGGAATRRRRSRTRLVGALVGVAGLAVVVPGPAVAAGNGNALDSAKYDEPGTYQLKVTDRSAALEAIAAQPGVEPVSFPELVESRSGDTGSCGDACRIWPDHLNEDDRWYPQGVAGSEESNWADAPETEVLVSAWYQRTSPDNHAAVSSALKFVSTDDWQYRNVPLRLPVETDGRSATAPLTSPDGGPAFAGPILPVAPTALSPPTAS